MHVSLPKDLEHFLNELVETGLYPCAEEAICDGLRLLKEQNEVRKVRLKDLREEVAKGLEQANRGELVDGEEAFREIYENLERASSQQQ